MKNIVKYRKRKKISLLETLKKRSGVEKYLNGVMSENYSIYNNVLPFI